MKRAPVIPKHTVKDIRPETEPSAAPAAPMVDSLIARVGAMARGNTILLPVCGREVKFILETVPVITACVLLYISIIELFSDCAVIKAQ